MPKHLKDEDVQCEYPVDADDEYVTERGFQPTLPGESTKLSSALALFKASRILSKVLEEVFPAQASYELSLKKLSELSDELDAWSASLAPHLRLQFAQDKPSTGTISSRSPLLSLTYHYIRALIQRPAICASLGSKSSSAMLAVAGSCKHMVQIIQLLEERGMCFSFCLNRDEILVLSGFGLLFQRLNLDPSSKILKDNQKMLCAIIEVLDKSKAPCATGFRRVACSFLPTQPVQVAPPAPKPKVTTLSRHNSDGSLPAPQSSSLPSSTKKQLKAIASRFTTNGPAKPPKLDPTDRRQTVHNISLHPHSAYTQSQPTLSPVLNYDPSSISRSEPARSPLNMYSRPASTVTRPSAPPQLAPKPKHKFQPQRKLNLDYLSFGNESGETVPKPVNLTPIKPEPQPTDWEKLLGSLDNGPTNIFDACYGGQPVEALMDAPSLGKHANASTTAIDDGSIAWNSDLWALCQTDTNTSSSSGLTESTGHPGSIWSFSTDDGIGSTDDLTNSDWASANGSHNGSDSHKGIMMPADFGLGEDVNFGSAWDAGLQL